MGGPGSGRKSPIMTPLRKLVAQEIVLSGDASISEVARAYGVSRQYIHYQVRGQLVPRKYSDELIREVRELWKAGVSATQIGKRLGIDRHGLCRHVQDMPRPTRVRQEIKVKRKSSLKSGHCFGNY